MVKLKKTEITVFLSILICCISACSKTDDERILVSNLENFTAATIKGIYNIILVQDTVNKIIISGREHISSVEAGVINDTLYIEDRRRISLMPGRNTLEIHFRNLEYISTLDAVNISNTDTLHAERFYYDALGEIAEADLKMSCNYLFICTSANTLGNLTFSGKAGYFSIFNRYGTSIIASDLKCREVVITTQSIGKDYVNATDFLQVYIQGPGNVYYTGNPVIDLAEKTGTGNLMRNN